jgi:signal transduction histidine kinase
MHSKPFGICLAIVVVAAVLAAVYARDGMVRGASHVARDISDRRQLEMQRLHTQKLESLGILAGGVAHDFNNLLTGTLGNASLAVDSMHPSNPNRRVLEECTRAAERAAQLTRQLLAYAGKGRFETEAINLWVLVREINTLIQTSISRKVQVRLELADDIPLIEADSGQMQQVVMNLALRASRTSGSVAMPFIKRSSAACCCTVRAFARLALAASSCPMAFCRRHRPAPPGRSHCNGCR